MKLKEIKPYLKNGWFIIINNDSVIRFSVSEIFTNFKRIVKYFFKIKIVHSKIDTSDTPKGDRLIIRSSDKQILIIDNPSFVYRKYRDFNQFDKVKKGHSTLEKFYNIAQVVFLSENITKENFVMGKPLTDFDAKIQFCVFEDIVSKYHKALEINFEALPARISVDRFLLAAEEVCYPPEMKKYFVSNKDKVYKLFSNLSWVWSHGDLTPQNVLYNGDEYLIIDGERCEILPVFYDIANLMNSYVIMSNTNKAYQNYFAGKYDLLITCVINKSEINSDDRKIIILIMLLLKYVVAWDVHVKKNDDDLMCKRWDAIKEFILED